MPAPERVPPVHRPTSVADLPLFSEPARTRHTDPATSVRAAASVSTGNLERRVLRVLRVAQQPKTSHEIASILGEHLVSVSPRMKPLEERGLVVREGKNGRRTLWRAADAA